MITTVTLIEQFTSESVGNQIYIGDREKCGSPRDIYEAYSGEPIYLSEGTSNIWINYYKGHINCQYSQGVLGQDICESISGCEWVTPTFFWIPTSDPTCKGQFNYSFIDEYGTQFYNYRVVINRFENERQEISRDICEHPAVLDNQTLCDELSCNWEYRLGENINYDADDINANLGTVSKIWSVTKKLATFKFDFGFENKEANYILHFLIFRLPLLGLGLALYVLIRS